MSDLGLTDGPESLPQYASPMELFLAAYKNMVERCPEPKEKLVSPENSLDPLSPDASPMELLRPEPEECEALFKKMAEEHREPNEKLSSPENSYRTLLQPGPFEHFPNYHLIGYRNAGFALLDVDRQKKVLEEMHRRKHARQKASDAMLEQYNVLSRKHVISEMVGPTVEHQPGSSRSGQQKRAMLGRKHQAKYGSNDQTINYDNLTSHEFTKNSENQKNVTDVRPNKLIFSNKRFQQVHTGQPIKGEDGHSLSLKLVDCQSGELVTSIPEASASLEIVVLKADIGEDGREGFKSSIVRKEGNRPLLTGNVNVRLKQGIACLSTVRFSQCKIWRKMCNYRLGAIALGDDMGAKIKEGVTVSFTVKDGRLKDNKKDYPLTLDSEVWRLANIAKDGPFHRSLSVVNINTAGDFLKELNSDSKKLHDVLGQRMYSGMWNDLVTHAKTLEVGKSQEFSTVERSIDTSIIISPRLEEHEFSQTAISFSSNETSVGDPSLGNRMRSINYPQTYPIQESCSGGKVLVSSETVELSSPNSVIPSRDFLDPEEYINFDRENELLKPNDHGGLEHEDHERTLRSPVDLPFTTNEITLESVDEPERIYKYYFNDSLEENITQLDEIWYRMGHGTHSSSA